MGLSLRHLLLSAFFFICAGQDPGSAAVFTINSIKLEVHPATEVESGTRVTLKCEVDVSQEGSQLLTYQFSFFKDLDLLHSQNTTVPHVTHQLEPARAAHSGEYCCSMKIQSKKKISNTKIVTVSGLQTPVLTLEEKNVVEGEALMATCSAAEESGKLCFTFYANSTEVKRQCSSNNSVQVQLTLEGAGTQYLLCNFQLYLTRMRSNNSNTVKVLVKELPIAPTISIYPSKSIIEGDWLKVQCDVIQVPLSLLSKLNVFLNKGNTILSSGPRNASWETEKALAAKHSGNYMCKSEMDNLQKSISALVDVAELFSQPILTVNPPEVFEGEQFTLACESANVSTERIKKSDIKYNIYKDNEIFSHSTVVAKLSDSGNYACQGVAKTIPKNSSTIALKVKELVSSPLIMVQGAVVLDTPFTIFCRSEKGSFPISYTLLKRRQPKGIYTARSPGEQAAFRVSINTTQEITEFTCEAENNGHQSKKLGLTLNATVIEPLSTPELYAAPELEEGSELNLSCSVKKGSLPITFTWYRDDTLLYSQHTDQRMKIYTVKDVTEDSSYYCEAVNLANERMQSKPQTVRVTFSKWKKVLIGTFVLLAVVAIIAGVLLCRPKQGKKSAKELSTKATSPKPESDSVVVSVVHGGGSYSQVSGDDTKKTVWSESTSDSSSEDQSSEDNADKADLEYAEHVQLQPMASSEAPPKKGTDTVYSEVQNSAKGQSES
ncbi:platelet endothelial cell adhesion molecule-like isoform X1 [Arapaima gigas]